MRDEHLIELDQSEMENDGGPPPMVCDRYRTLFESSRDAILVTSPTGRILDVNDATSDLFGFDRSEMLGMDARDLFVEPSSRARYLEALKSDGGFSDYELKLRRKNGGTIVCLVTSNVRKDCSGGIIEHQDIIRDVTDQRRQEEWLRMFKAAVDAAQIGVTITDLERHILYVNPSEAAAHGYECEELIGRNSSVLGSRKGPESVDEAAATPTPWKRTGVNVRRDGTRIPVMLYSDIVRDQTGEPIGVLTCCEDLGDHPQADEQIRKLYRAVEQSPSLVVITDVDGKIEYVNPCFTEVTGFTQEEAVGENPRVLKSGRMDPTVYSELWRTITGGETWTGEFLNRRKDGSLYWCVASISGLCDDRGEVRHYVGVQQDITERKQLEIELERQNRRLERLNRLKSELMAVTSHDLKSPLHAMVSIASLLKEMGDTLSREKELEFVDRIISSGHKLSRFISEILDAEKIEAGRLELDLKPIRLGDFFEDCLRVASDEGRENQVTISLNLLEAVPEVLGDATRLEQIFTNLLSNAVKFSPIGGKISIEIRESGSMVETVVQDEGPGIPEADLEEIFDRYYQVANENGASRYRFGAGLGLYIAHQLVGLHGGTIHAENRRDGKSGSRFVVRLPHAETERTAGKTSVLALDPEGWIGGWLPQALRRSGAELTEVKTIEELLRGVTLDRPDVVILPRLSSSPVGQRAVRRIKELADPGPRIISIEDQHPVDRLPSGIEFLLAPVADSDVADLMTGIGYEGRRRTPRT